MIPGIIGGHIGRANRNLLIFNVVMVAVLLGVLVVARGFLYNFFVGPQTVNVGDIPKMDPDTVSRYWVKAAVDPSQFERGYVELSGRKQSTRYYFVLDLPQGGLLIESGTKEPGPMIEGTVSYLTGEANSKVIPLLTRPFGKALLPVMVQNSSLRFGGWMFLLIWTSILLLGVWNIFKAVKRMGDPRQHPVCAVLKRFGEPEEIAVGIDAEFKAGTQATGNVQLTQSWLMRKKSFGLDLVYLGDVVWAYKKEVKHSTNGVPTGTTYSSMVYDKYGKSLDLGLKKGQVEELLGNIHRAVPWVLVGFDKELQAMWGKDRKQMLGIVEGRKEAYLKAASEPQANAPPVQN